MQNRSFVKNSFKRAVFAEENYPLAKGINQNESFDYAMNKHFGDVQLKGVLDHSKYVTQASKMDRKNSQNKYLFKNNF